MSIPPGRSTRVTASRIMVVAPHYDDEVLGCGGLLMQLVAQGAAVRVLFLSDSSGGEEQVPDRQAYADARRRESEAVLEALGAAGRHELMLPDGSLQDHVVEIAAAVRAQLIEYRPDLLLAPGPDEVSLDHRAAFAAVRRALSPVRRGDALGEVLQGLDVLLYEVNHAGHPDILVDVTEQLAGIRELMRCYVSQESRHGYLRAALGLRAFRTLTLDSGVEAAEGYRRLAVEDVAGSPSSVRSRHPRIGDGTADVPVSVITRTLDRPRRLAEALASLAASTHRAVELVLVNDGGERPDVPAGFPFPVTRVELDPVRGRGGAAQAGLEAAGGRFVAFLDDDDLYRPEHLAVLLQATSGGAGLVYSDAMVVSHQAERSGGWERVEERIVHSRDFDADLLLLDNYIPLITVLVARDVALQVGGFDPEIGILEDWDFLLRVSAATRPLHVPRVTCEYRHFLSAREHGVAGPSAGRVALLEMRRLVLEKHAGDLDPARVARGAYLLTRELTEAREDLERLGRQLRSGESPWQQLGRLALGRALRWWRTRRNRRIG